VWEVEPTPTTTLTPDLAEVQRIQVTVPCAAVGVFETLADALRDGTAPQEQRAIPLSVVSAPENVRCFPLDTDEMAPLLPRGTVVALDKGRRREDLDGKIIAARTAEGDLRVLRLKIIHHGRWGEFPQLVPENPACQDTSNPILLEDSGTAIIGQIVWAWLDLRNPPK
jgi:phage repressor protein C with HTH and peptisase S24 domain